MPHPPRYRWTRLLILLAASLLTACAARAPTIPTAIIYNRDADTWRVEVEPVVGEPEYRETLPIFTEAAGQRHDGLIPPARFRTLNRHGGLPSWSGPVGVRHEESFWRDNPWRVHEFMMKLPIVHDADSPADVEIRLDERLPGPPPRYRVWVKGAGRAR
jgi:hypothetical protein